MLTVMVSDADDVIKAEIIQALKIICGEDSLFFSVMFPDSKSLQFLKNMPWARRS
jgi:hypothetical protein